jgi:DNA-binding XRE family transcriptional regulator
LTVDWLTFNITDVEVTGAVGATGCVYLLVDPHLHRWGLELTALMEAHRLTRADVAEALDVDPLTVWRWQHGRREPRRHHKIALARLLNTSVDSLFSLRV